MKSIIFILSLLAIGSVYSKTNVTIFFESECPASRLFIGKSFGTWLDALVNTKDNLAG